MQEIGWLPHPHKIDLSGDVFFFVASESIRVRRNAVYRKSNRPICLLLVEDNPADVMMLELGLNETGARYDLHVVKDGEAALELLARRNICTQIGSPDLILLDLNLPKVDGHEVLRAVKTHPDLKTTPVIVLSSSRSLSDIHAAYAAGANSYIPKAASADETFDLVRTIQHYWLDLAVLPANPPAMN